MNKHLEDLARILRGVGVVASKTAADRWVARSGARCRTPPDPGLRPPSLHTANPAVSCACSSLIKRLTENDYSVVLRTAAAAQRRSEGKHRAAVWDLGSLAFLLHYSFVASPMLGMWPMTQFVLVIADAQRRCARQQRRRRHAPQQQQQQHLWGPLNRWRCCMGRCQPRPCSMRTVCSSSNRPGPMCLPQPHMRSPSKCL